MGVKHMATDKPRYSITVDDELFQRIEDFRFENRFQTRNEATVALIKRGLEAIGNEKIEVPSRRSKQ